MLQAIEYEILRGVKADEKIKIPLDRQPVRVCTLIDEEEFDREKALVHNKTVFLEDRFHDYRYENGHLRYYSRVKAVADVVVVYALRDDTDRVLSTRANPGPLPDQSAYLRTGSANAGSDQKYRVLNAPETLLFGKAFKDPDARFIQVDTEDQLSELLGKLVESGGSFSVNRNRIDGITVKTCKEFTDPDPLGKRAWYSVSYRGAVEFIGTFATAQDAARTCDGHGTEHPGRHIVDESLLRVLVQNAMRVLPPLQTPKQES